MASWSDVEGRMGLQRIGIYNQVYPGFTPSWAAGSSACGV